MTDHDGQFRKSLTTLDLTMIGFGSIFGSGWLFAASHVSTIAGPASVFSWVFGGFAVLLLGLVYCELGAALPHAGGIVRYPEYSHGPLCGFLMALVTVIAFSSLIAIEIVAARQYAGAWIPGLTRDAAGDPTFAGWCVQLAVLMVLFQINRAGVSTFAFVNNIVTIFKFCVPTLVVFALFAHLDTLNFSSHGFATHGAAGVEAAISTGGIIFAYLGLTPIISVAGEARNPQRAIPVALITSVLLSTIVYVALQAAFVGSIPSAMLQQGWDTVAGKFSLPFHDIAIALGLGWLGILVVTDAVISPTGTGNIYMSSTARVIYAWAKGGTFFRQFVHVSPKSGVPERSLVFTFLLALFWTLPFPSWQALISVVSSALMMSYAVAPVAAAALRRTAPDLARPFRLSLFNVISPAAFVIASLIVFWTGWHTLYWLLLLQLALAVVFVAVRIATRGMAEARAELHASGWLVAYLAGLVVISAAGSFEGSGVIWHPLDDGVVALFSLVIYEWGRRTGNALAQDLNHIEKPMNMVEVEPGAA